MEHLDFYVKTSLQEGAGMGLYARRDYKKGDFVIEYTGVRIPTKIADEHKGRYLFEIDEKWTVDGEVSTNPARYINHSCDPNTEAEIEKGADREGHIMIYAHKDIADGEEMYIDYGDEYFNEFIRLTGCRCGSANCRSRKQHLVRQK